MSLICVQRSCSFDLLSNSMQSVLSRGTLSNSRYVQLHAVKITYNAMNVFTQPCPITSYSDFSCPSDFINIDPIVVDI